MVTPGAGRRPPVATPLFTLSQCFTYRVCCTGVTIWVENMITANVFGRKVIGKSEVKGGKRNVGVSCPADLNTT